MTPPPTGPAEDALSNHASESLATTATTLDELIAQFSGHDAFANQIIEGMPVGVVIQGQDGSIAFANAAAAHILRLTMAQLTGRTSMDPSWRSVHDDGSPFPGDQHPAMVTLRTDLPSHALMGVQASEDPMSWIEASSTPIHTESGALLAVQTLFVDVTGQRNAQHEQQAALMRFERIAAEASDVIALLDADGVITEVTASSPTVLGRPTGALVGMPLGDLLDSSVEFDAMLADLVDRSGATARLTAPVHMPGSGDRHFEIRLRNRFDDPHLGSIVATLADVQERVAAEAALRVANLDLERRLDELDRTHQLDSLLGHAASLLTECRDLNEVADVLWDTLNQAFPRSDIAVRLDSGSGHDLGIVRSRAVQESAIESDDCWAIRTRQVHSADTGGVRCEHRLPEGLSICIPVMVEGRAVGSMTVSDDRLDLESLLLTGDKIAARITQSIPPAAVATILESPQAEPSIR